MFHVDTLNVVWQFLHKHDIIIFLVLYDISICECKYEDKHNEWNKKNVDDSWKFGQIIYWYADNQQETAEREHNPTSEYRIFEDRHEQESIEQNQQGAGENTNGKKNFLVPWKVILIFPENIEDKNNDESEN